VLCIFFSDNPVNKKFVRQQHENHDDHQNDDQSNKKADI
jgi:hypothetical protein